MNWVSARVRLTGEIHIELETPWTDDLDNPMGDKDIRREMEIIIADALAAYFKGKRKDVICVQAQDVTLTEVV